MILYNYELLKQHCSDIILLPNKYITMIRFSSPQKTPFNIVNYK